MLGGNLRAGTVLPVDECDAAADAGSGDTGGRRVLCGVRLGIDRGPRRCGSIPLQLAAITCIVIRTCLVRIGAPVKPLDGVRVLDLSRMIAGGVAGMLLADFGADVVKVEQPETGDPLRQWTAEGQPFWWKVYARNKRYITLNLKSAEGRASARAADSAIRHRPGVVRAGDARTAGTRVGTCCRPGIRGLIVVRISGWGQTGPASQRPGFGTLVEAASGFAAMNGEPDGAPIVPAFPLADMSSALYAVNAVMFALYHRDVHHGGRPGDRRLAVRVAVLAARSVAGRVSVARDVCASAMAADRRTPGRAAAIAPMTAAGSPSAARRRRWRSDSSRPTDSSSCCRTSAFRTNEARVRHAAELDEQIARRSRARTLAREPADHRATMS